MKLFEGKISIEVSGGINPYLKHPLGAMQKTIFSMYGGMLLTVDRKSVV